VDTKQMSRRVRILMILCELFNLYLLFLISTGEVKELLKFAADNGVMEARNLLEGLCRQKPKHCDHWCPHVMRISQYMMRS
jgi:hypothetical protein